MRHYDVQLLGGLILHDGRLAEMATGEVNDYLARRDMEKMGQVHRFLGLTVGLIQSGMSEDERREAYKCDVVYVTNSELGFDYLRDHLALGPQQTVLPGGGGEFDGFCVVDEADSVPAPANKYQVANTLAGALKKDVHYTVDLKNKNVVLNERGYRDCENALGIMNLFEVPEDGSGAWAPFVSNAIKAKELFTKDVEYSVTVDEKTGERN
eukprot:3867802-Ditylum_brightwellii.AAC.1